MRKYFISFAILALTALNYGDAYGAANFRMFSSDTVGVKLEYPSSGWKVEEFRWGFAVIENGTQSSLTVKVQYFPKEYEKAYDIDLNKEFEKVYVGKFEELIAEKRQLDGLQWDYSMIIGAKGSPLEYCQEMYTTLIQNSLYSVELYYQTSSGKDVKDNLQKIKDSVRLMYKKSELPMIRDYLRSYNSAKSNNAPLEFTALGNRVTIKYQAPWAFSGGGTGSEGGFHYFSGDPYTDIDMILIKHEANDPREAIIALKSWVGLLTDAFNLIEENTITYGKNKYHYQKLVQGSGEHLLNTWMAAMKLENGGTAVIVFAFHQKAMDKAPMLIDEFMKQVVFK